MAEKMTKADLEKAGATCELVTAGWWECQGKDGTKWWCDTESCQPKPRPINPRRWLLVLRFRLFGRV